MKKLVFFVAALILLGFTVTFAIGSAAANSIGYPVAGYRWSKPCRDSNGFWPGGSVYWSYFSGPVTCTLSPLHRLHITQTPNRTMCSMYGGNYAQAQRICWDVDV